MTQKIKVVVIVGARPNFMKAAPLLRAMRAGKKIEPVLIHTGQHYDQTMSGSFFEDLKLPKPDLFLNVGSGTHAAQTAKIMLALESELIRLNPRLVIVVGDVNSTIAAALTAKKLGIQVAHVESGLRSFDETMPEEINRILTDHISDYLFVTESSGIKNLRREGIDSGKIFFVGNVMIDSLYQNLPQINRSEIIGKIGVTKKNYAVLTLHRPVNVDAKESLAKILKIITEAVVDTEVVFPVHPRTRKNFEAILADESIDPRRIKVVEPLGYLDFNALVKDSLFVLTDSGGIQEETTALGIPCITLRETTERPITVILGTNHIAGTDPKKITAIIKKIKQGKNKKNHQVPKWDGRAAERVVKILQKKL